MVDIKKIELLINPILIKEDVTLYSVEYKNKILKILIDSAKGIDLDKCVAVSEAISKELDKKDLIKEEYCLEVASAGAERPLKNKEDFKNALNKFILVQVASRVLDYDELVGTLKEVKDESIVLEIKIKTVTKKVEIAINNITYAITTVNI